ncbi:hypothetical protein CASFOL_040936 [Castilleja foliolosa]|uniref:Uncharacterized protein n=1 Tax=Castilleja foliolosa TaxID=1961234 RepID=A0ABD3BD19_9LAMI
MKTNFHLILIAIITATGLLLLFTTTTLVSSSNPPGKNANFRQLFHPRNDPTPKVFESKKRRVPTGSNPLHNKRR